MRIPYVFDMDFVERLAAKSEQRVVVSLKRLRETVQALDEARAALKHSRFIEDCRGDGLTYECNLTRPCVSCRVRTVAERQREACAVRVRHAFVSDGMADFVRKTPLVTEVDK